MAGATEAKASEITDRQLRAIEHQIRFYEFAGDLIDNDTLIIIGLFIISGFNEAVAGNVVSGLIGYLGAKIKYGGPKNATTPV